jgi:Tfp pilus assembly protein PilO
MTIQQIPSPPPVDPNLLFSNGDAPAVIVMIVLAALLATTIILWPIMRALGRRLEHRGDPDPAVRAEIEQVHRRLADLDAIQVRVAELEERLDFAERLLAQSKDPERLSR